MSQSTWMAPASATPRARCARIAAVAGEHRVWAGQGSVATASCLPACQLEAKGCSGVCASQQQRVCEPLPCHSCMRTAPSQAKHAICCCPCLQIPFLDHMMDQLASHGLFDVTVEAQGDTWIDDHHTNEVRRRRFISQLWGLCCNCVGGAGRRLI